jgi:hypothetical protein
VKPRVEPTGWYAIILALAVGAALLVYALA